MAHKSSQTYPKIYAVVKRIPKGRVATYGQVAALAGFGGQPRLVGYALHGAKDGERLPWQRVINAKGEVSRRSVPGWDLGQRAMLESEGIVFDERDRVDLKKFQWRPRT